MTRLFIYLPSFDSPFGLADSVSVCGRAFWSAGFLPTCQLLRPSHFSLRRGANTASASVGLSHLNSVPFSDGTGGVGCHLK